MIRFPMASRWWASLLFAGLGLACTDEKEPMGQLMLAFDSDMAVPKDVNIAELRAAVGALSEGTRFELGPPGSRLPATLGVRSGDGKTLGVDLSLVAGKDERLRTVGLVKTTIPEDRIALVRMPIQWLCTLRVRDVDDETRASDCKPDETCNAGRCEPAEIAENDLPTYDPADVFGGGVGDGPSGVCFDTRDGFAAPRGQLVTSEIDLDTCRAPLLSDSMNFALRVRGGDGICIDEDLCLVTLNRSAVTGWYEVNEDGEADEDGGFAQLPTIVCEELGPGTGAILGVYAAPSLPVKVPEIPICAPWSSAGLDPGGGGGKVDPDSTCPELGSGKPGADIVEDPLVARFMDLSSSLSAARRELYSELAQSCVAIAGGLGADDVWSPLGYDPERPTEQSVQAACANAAASLFDAVRAVRRMKVGLTPAQCTVDGEAQLDCEAACSPAGECREDERCLAESTVGECSGECAAGSTCEGALDDLTRCHGLCHGICKGTCEGICTRVGGAAPCEGVCEAGACIGQCAGDCELDLPTRCGTGSACRGECGEARDEVTCSQPLAACEDVDPSCSSVCAMSSASAAVCEPGVPFTAVSPLEVQDEELEELLTDEILAELSRLSLISARASRLVESREGLDVDAIVDRAAEAGVKDNACARSAGAVVLPALVDFAAIDEYAHAVIDPVLALRAEWPLQCEILRASGTPCQRCIAENCCPELARCQRDPRCLGSDFQSGEALCVINCVANDASGADEQTVRDMCASQCITPSYTRLSANTVAMLVCIDSNVGGGCEEQCYGEAFE